MKKLYRNDLILNAAVILVCIAVPLFLFFNGKDEKKSAVISYDGKQEKVISIDGNEVFKTHGVEITVKDGTAYVSESSCPDGLCMKMKKAENIGDSIICVPNRVSVRIDGNGREEGADVIVG